MKPFLRPAFCCFLQLLIVVLIFPGCNSQQGKSINNAQNKKKSAGKVFKLEEPYLDQLFGLNDSIQFRLSGAENIQPDSTLLFIEGEMRHKEKQSPLAFGTGKLFRKVGRQSIRLKVFYNDSNTQNLSARVILFSDRPPEKLNYEVVRRIPHNRNDFIQGLIYHEGFLYEGTGREQRSRLIKLDPDNGRVLMERKLEDRFFGEGITRVDDRIYQLTYKHKVGFVYNLHTFEKIREFDLQTMEGWGLTYDTENLIMSDGSSRLYFFDPNSITQVRQLDVAHNKGLVTGLNELEYTPGSIWANVYGKSIIVRIDAQTGIVLGELDLDPLFPPDVPRDYDHVLNGIAHNPEDNTFFVTGKLWPVLYEIRIKK